MQIRLGINLEKENNGLLCHLTTTSHNGKIHVYNDDDAQ